MFIVLRRRWFYWVFRDFFDVYLMFIPVKNGVFSCNSVKGQSGWKRWYCVVCGILCNSIIDFWPRLIREGLYCQTRSLMRMYETKSKEYRVWTESHHLMKTHSLCQFIDKIRERHSVIDICAGLNLVFKNHSLTLKLFFNLLICHSVIRRPSLYFAYLLAVGVISAAYCEEIRFTSLSYVGHINHSFQKKFRYG